jgi:Leucine-rich repeat (LRR) protein
MPYGILARWVAQQPLGRTLQSLTMTGGGWTFDLSQLTPLTGLRHLHLDACTLASSSSLSSFSSLQTLVLDGRMDDVGAVQALTGLQRLTLHTRAEADTHMAAGLFSALRPLRHLTHLHVTHDYLSEVPAELGEWAPRLEDVAFKSCRLRTVPSSLTCLKRLELDICPVDTFSVPTTLTCLRTLLISASFRSIAGLDACTALEFLAVTGTEAFATSLPSLRPLTRLCHLDLHESNSADPAALTVVGALQQLTYLNLRHSSWVLRPLATMWSGLAVAAALPGLQQLEISYWSRWGTYPVITGEGWFPLATLGPWLSGCTALTKLVASGNDVSSDDELLYLPAGLRELAFQSMTHRQLQQLPCGLSRLSALRVLDASCNPRLCQLPSSLARLQRLEALSLQGTGVVSEQAVLAQMPNLKRVGLPVQASAAVVFGAATHIVNGLTPSVHMDDGGAVYSVLHQLMAAE